MQIPLFILIVGMVRQWLAFKIRPDPGSDRRQTDKSFTPFLKACCASSIKRSDKTRGTFSWHKYRRREVWEKIGASTQSWYIEGRIGKTYCMTLRAFTPPVSSRTTGDEACCKRQEDSVHIHNRRVFTERVTSTLRRIATLPRLASCRE